MEQQAVEQQEATKDAAEAQLKGDKEKEEKKKKKEEKESIATDLRQHPNAPSQEVIDQWKAKFGEVFVSGFSQEEMFIWRPVTREEWGKLQQMSVDAEVPMTQLQYEELLCNLCTLWKSVDILAKGGTASTLYEQILLNSNFLPAQAASMLVMKL
jgi:hypothetical protein